MIAHDPVIAKPPLDKPKEGEVAPNDWPNGQATGQPCLPRNTVEALGAFADFLERYDERRRSSL